MNLVFRDNFFSAGITEILNEQNENMGSLDLKSALGSSIEVYGPQGRQLFQGSFRFFSNKWEVSSAEGELAGVLRSRFSWSGKKFTYETEGRGVYEIDSPAFSKEYEIADETRIAASFTQLNGWLSPGAYLLENSSKLLDSYELVAVIMGVHAIQKRHRSAAST
ncbi:hypothetical protein KIH86_01450 [Paenibacillus sp. HN-1]|uniref:hypothetical protein n=1 Tax=Paenibacillus TaxID=44249 RepID=UPI001CA99706|nr:MULTISPECIES: hypothetical protein [Paenibacillus]MBY9079648.1 hypothetical protein [Paenibacillus sp. CGMCC 1.18879]MBY9082899.1 hypothetical protein [Paenibacillus sinensis]